MIKLNELRYFNFLHYFVKGEGFLLTKIDWQDLKHLEENPKDFNKDYKPITLTHDWLKRLGFTSLLNDRGVFQNNIVSIQERTIENDSELRFYYNHKRIMYVHELQNLFFALTGIELEINHTEQ